MKSSHRLLLPLSSFALLAACSGSSGTDAGAVDMSTHDAGLPSDASLDTGATDAGSTDGGGADSGHTRPTTSPGYTPGAPITATADTWTWVDFPGARCQDGSPTGLGVNLHPGSDRVVIYLEGGGACFNTFTCLTVANPNGYGHSDFGTGSGLSTYPMFSRTDTTNPFHDWNMVYVPYCSGDIFAGNNPDDSPIPGKTFVGYVNVGEFLNRLVPTFSGASQVVLTGSSAGGFGAAYNWDRAQAAFGATPVILLDDSGPIMSPTYLKPCLQDKLLDVWNLNATLPADCTTCRMPGGGLSTALHYVAAAHPDRQVGLLSGTTDGVIRTFMGVGYSADCDGVGSMPGADYTAGLLELRDTTLADIPKFHAYYIGNRADSSSHTWLNRPASSYLAPGTPPVPLNSWIQAFIDDSPEFVDVGP